MKEYFAWVAQSVKRIFSDLNAKLKDLNEKLKPYQRIIAAVGVLVSIAGIWLTLNLMP